MVRNIQDALAVVKGAYFQNTDPGAVGAGKMWIDTSSGPPFALSVRNITDTGWQDVGTVPAILIGGNAEGVALVIGTTDNNVLNFIVNSVIEATLASTGLTVTNDISAVGVTASGNIQGVDLNATGVFKVDGTQVVSNQGAAVAAVASADAPAQTAAYVQADVEAIRAVANEAKAQLNTLLARLRAHGLIAT